MKTFNKILFLIILLGFAVSSHAQGFHDTKHKVAPGETLWSISKKYNTTVDAIKQRNAALRTRGLAANEVILIPSSSSGGAKKTTHTSGQKSVVTHGDKHHIVKKGETVYSISRQYNLSVSQIKSLNHLKNNNISIGQDLIVGQGEKPSVKKPTPVVSATVTPTRKERRTERKTTERNAQKDHDQTIYKRPESKASAVSNEEVVQSKEISEEGFAEVIEAKSASRKYTALHKTAKVGTMMQVINKMNQNWIYVRIIGNIPNTGNDSNVLLKISKAAFEKLGGIDKKFPVSLHYIN